MHSTNGTNDPWARPEDETVTGLLIQSAQPAQPARPRDPGDVDYEEEDSEPPPPPPPPPDYPGGGDGDEDLPKPDEG